MYDRTLACFEKKNNNKVDDFGSIIRELFKICGGGGGE